MRAILLSTAFLTLPMIGLADTIPVYQQEGGDLIYTGETMTVEEAVKLVGFGSGSFAFDKPEFVVETHQGYVPSFVPPEYYELVSKGDGKIEGAPDDLVFDESEGMDLRDDMTFDQSEGLDTRDDLTFGEREGTDTRDDLTFGENEGLDLLEGTTPSENEDQTSQDDLTFDETEGTNVGDDLTFSEDEVIKSVEAEGVPRELLEKTYGATITPQDGTWRVTILEAVAAGCPPGAEEQARAQILRSTTLNVTFSKPNWHPSDLGGELGQFTWTKIGQNGYFSYPYATGAEAEGSGISLAVSTLYTARSSTSIDTWYRIRVNLSPALAAMAQSSEECEVLILGELSK